MDDKKLVMRVQMSVIDHLGIQLYSKLAPVICELIANAWDADASSVKITIPEGQITDSEKIVIEDNGEGMTFKEINDYYLKIGRNRRIDLNKDITNLGRKVMGRKGLGKISVFGVCNEVIISTRKNGKLISFKMNIDDIRNSDGKYEPEILAETNCSEEESGTVIILAKLKRKRPISVQSLITDIARRFSVFSDNFQVYVNGKKVGIEDRNLDLEYFWEIDEFINENKNHKITGWIGTTKKPIPEDYGKGIIITARGKLVQEPTLFEVSGGREHAYAYMVGELAADYLDEEKDFIATHRTNIVWESEEGQELLEWGRKKVKEYSKLWEKNRIQQREKVIREKPLFSDWYNKLPKKDKKLADKIVSVITSTPDLPQDKADDLITFMISSFEHQSFKEFVNELEGTEDDIKLLELFKEWAVLEARELFRVMEGRIATIEKFEEFINNDAREVPTLHRFFRDFPWILDPRWTIWKDEVTYSKILREKFDDSSLPEKDRRIDFICIGFSDTLHVIELKRPSKKISRKELEQINDYIDFAQAHIKGNDPEFTFTNVKGYLIAGGIVDNPEIRNRVVRLRNSGIFVRYYSDLLSNAKRLHQELLNKYRELKDIKTSLGADEAAAALSE